MSGLEEPQAEPFASSLQHILAELERIDLLIRVQVWRARQLAEADGLQVLETVKAGESPPVVIVLAAFPYPQHRQKCLEAGAEYFLDKTTEFDQIAKVLEGLVENAS